VTEKRNRARSMRTMDEAYTKLRDTIARTGDVLLVKACNDFVGLAKSKWRSGGEVALGNYVASTFGSLSTETKNAIVTHLVKTICEREH